MAELSECVEESARAHLTVDDLFEVMSELEPAKDQWYNIGLGLKVRQNDLDSLQSEGKSPMDCFREMLEIWLDQTDTPATWQQVVDVLRSPAIENQDNLAEGLQQKYLSCSLESEGDEVAMVDTNQEEDMKLGEAHLYDISNYLTSLSEPDIFSLSQALGLHSSTVTPFRNSPFFLDEVLMRWLQGMDQVMERGGHTWKALVKALREPKVNQQDIADKIEKETQ